MSFPKSVNAWINDRLVLIPQIVDNLDALLIPISIAAVSKFDRNILSDRFEKFTPHFKRAASIICWSQGNQDIQGAKLTVVKRRWADAGIDVDGIPELIDEVKTDKIDSILAQAYGFLGKDKKGNRVPLVIIEDKITNMMKFMHAYIAKKDPDNNIPLLDEDSLDLEGFDFDKYLKNWTMAIKTYTDRFLNCKFIYVPPDKSDDYKSGDTNPPLRVGRIRSWIEASNKAIKAARVRNTSHVSLPNTVYQYFPGQFFHIDDKSTDLGKIITSRSLVVADVDGPLVSQRKVLETRESSLVSAYRNTLEMIYREIFGVGFKEIADFFLYPTNAPGFICRKIDMATGELSGEIFLGMGTDFIKSYYYRNYAVLFKDIFPGVIVVNYRFNHKGQSDFESPSEYIMEFDQNRFRQAFESLKYDTPW